MDDGHSLSAPRWSVVVVASRETPAVLMQTLNALAQAIRCSAQIDVVVNGDIGLARAVASRLGMSDARPPTPGWRLWHVELADKANAINQYVHRIFNGGETVFFVDGYARVRQDALLLLSQALDHCPQALAAAALPTAGRSAATVARTLIQQGGVHGNLFAVRGSAMQQMVMRDFRLPIGLYRTDSTIGSALSFGLDPTRNTWDPKQFTTVAQGATWDLDAAQWWQPRDWWAQWKRMARQARGDIENWAVRHAFLVQRRPIGSLPRDVGALVREWAANDPAGVNDRIRSHRRRKAALQQLLATHHAADAAATPALLLRQWPAVENLETRVHS